MSGIAVRGLGCRYPGTSVPALDGVDLDVPRGTLVVVMGATGAGKSTLARCLTRLVPQFTTADVSGAIALDGASIDARSVGELAGTIGMVFQDFEAQLFSTDVMQEMVFALEQTGVPAAEMPARVAEALAAVGLTGFEGRDPTSLSGGEKQRLAIAGLLALQPGIMVFDEPTTDLDPQGRRDVFATLRALRARDMAALVIEHDPAAAVGADALVVLLAGRVAAAGPPAAILGDVAACERAGIRAPDVSRVFATLGIPDPPLDPAAAAVRLRDAGWRATPTPDPAPPAPSLPRLVVEHVSYRYDGGRVALDDVSLTIGQGELVALVGHNGSGKTTLAKHLLGLLAPTSGRVRLDDRPVGDMPPAELARRIGYVFQDPDHQLFAATVRDEVAFGPRNVGLAPAEVDARVREALAAVEIADADADPFLLDKGSRQRLAVAAVLSLRPDILVLDEPTTGLDHAEQQRMATLLRRLHADGRAVVVITHTPWVIAEHAQRVVMLRGGRLAYDGPVRDFFADDGLVAAAAFEAPDVTRLGRAFGCTPLSTDELLRWLVRG